METARTPDAVHKTVVSNQQRMRQLIDFCVTRINGQLDKEYNPETRQATIHCPYDEDEAITQAINIFNKAGWQASKVGYKLVRLVKPN